MANLFDNGYLADTFSKDALGWQKFATNLRQNNENQQPAVGNGLYRVANFINNFNDTINNGIGGAIDTVYDATLGSIIDPMFNLNTRENTSGQTFSIIPSLASDILLTSTGWGVPLVAGKYLADSADNLYRGMTGIDPLTGEALNDDKQQVASMLGGLGEAALAVIPGAAPLIKNGTKKLGQTMFNRFPGSSIDNEVAAAIDSLPNAAGRTVEQEVKYRTNKFLQPYYDELLNNAAKAQMLDEATVKANAMAKAKSAQISSIREQIAKNENKIQHGMTTKNKPYTPRYINQLKNQQNKYNNQIEELNNGSMIPEKLEAAVDAEQIPNIKRADDFISAYEKDIAEIEDFNELINAIDDKTLIPDLSKLERDAAESVQLQNDGLRGVVQNIENGGGSGLRKYGSTEAQKAVQKEQGRGQLSDMLESEGGSLFRRPKRGTNKQTDEEAIRNLGAELKAIKDKSGSLEENLSRDAQENLYNLTMMTLENGKRGEAAKKIIENIKTGKDDIFDGVQDASKILGSTMPGFSKRAATSAAGALGAAGEAYANGDLNNPYELALVALTGGLGGRALGNATARALPRTLGSGSMRRLYEMPYVAGTTRNPISNRMNTWNYLNNMLAYGGNDSWGNTEYSSDNTTENNIGSLTDEEIEYLIAQYSDYLKS